MTVFPVSFSRLQTFEQCERKYEYLYVTRSVVEVGNEYTDYGTRVHTALEEYAGNNQALPKELMRFRSLVDRVLQASGDKYFEQKMTVDAEHNPVAWDSPDAYVRGIADVLVVSPSIAKALDWKTGKPRDDDRQLKLMALLVFAHFPEVEAVDTAYIWLHHDTATRACYVKKDIGDLWKVFEAKIARIVDAAALGVFKAKPSPLCGWCPAKGVCPDRRR